jgi:hypothetical protein
MAKAWFGVLFGEGFTRAMADITGHGRVARPRSKSTVSMVNLTSAPGLRRRGG